MSEALGIGLRLVGAFYLLAALLGLRAVAMDRLLSSALDSLTLDPSSTSPGERRRQLYLLASSIGTGWAAIALCAELALAAPLFGLVWLGQVAFLLAAPVFVDSADPPEPGSRARSWRACSVYGAATALIAAAAWTGILKPESEQPWPAAVAGLAALLLAGYAAWLLSGMPGRGGRPASPGSEPDDEPDRDEVGGIDDDVPAGPSAQVLAYEAGTLRMVLTPSWGRGGLIDAETGLPIESEVTARIASGEIAELVEDWLCLFREVADPYHPRRCCLQAPEGLVRLEALGRPIYDSLVVLLGPDRVAFEPAPRPVLPEEDVRGGLDVMADYRCHPVWLNDPDRFGCVSPETLGISWSLARHLDVWSLTYDESFNLDDPGGPPRWSKEQYAAFDEEGRVLAVRLARELAATGRGQISVSVWMDGRKRPVSASDPLPGEGGAAGHP